MATTYQADNLSDTGEAMIRACYAWIRSNPRRHALHMVAMDLRWGAAAKKIRKMAARDVRQLTMAVSSCLMSILATEDNALDAFADAFNRTHRRIRAQELAEQRHAKSKALYEEAWRSYWRGGHTSVREFATAFANHHREDGAPKVRAYQDYFTKRAKEEGITFPRGRKPKPARV